MARYPTFLRSLLTLLIVLTGVSVSQAGLFGRWRARYNNPPPPPAATATTQQPSAPAPVQPAVAKAGPTVYMAAMPVIDEKANGSAASFPATAAPAPAPCVNPGTAPSTLPRSSWDFGKFPPYSN